MTKTAAQEVAVTLRSRRQSLYLGRNDNGPQFGNYEDHLLVLGPSRVGKTSGLIVPSVAVHPGPVVVVSTRPDIATPVLAARRTVAEKWGGTCVQLNIGSPIEGPLPSVTWSATTDCDSWNTALDRADVIVRTASPVVHDSFWPAAAADLLSCCLFGAALRGESDRAMAQHIDSTDVSSLYEAVYESCGDTHQITTTFGRFFDSDAMADDTRKSIFATVSSGPLGSFRYDEGPGDYEFNPAAFVRTSGTLFVTIPWTRQDTYKPRITALVEAIINAWRLFRGTGDHTLLLALDEVANVAPLPNLPKIVTAGAGDGIQLLLGMQAPDQAQRWGTDASVVLGDSSHLALFPGIKDERYLASLSGLLGEEVEYGLDVHVAPDTPNNLGAADHHRLIRERRYIDAAREASSTRQRRTAVLRAARTLAQHRLADGIRSRNGGAGPTSVLNELDRYTSTTRIRERRSMLPTSDLKTGRPGHFLLVERKHWEFREFLPYFTDPFWVTVLGDEAT